MTRRCFDTACIVRGEHDFHRDGKGRTWAFREPPLPEWRRRALEAVAARGLVAVKEVAR